MTEEQNEEVHGPEEIQEEHTPLDPRVEPVAVFPEVDPGKGEMANEEVSQARRDLETSLKDGSADLSTVFSQSDEEQGVSHRVVGHMHVKAVLGALPHIGDVRTQEILDRMGIAGDRHIDSIGSDERAKLVEAVNSYNPDS